MPMTSRRTRARRKLEGDIYSFEPKDHVQPSC
jgi:hypothetical protein